MAKKKPIKVEFSVGVFGTEYKVIGGSKKSRRVANDVAFWTIIKFGYFGDKSLKTPQEFEDFINKHLELLGYSTEV